MRLRGSVAAAVCAIGLALLGTFIALVHSWHMTGTTWPNTAALTAPTGLCTIMCRLGQQSVMFHLSLHSFSPVQQLITLLGNRDAPAQHGAAICITPLTKLYLADLNDQVTSCMSTCACILVSSSACLHICYDRMASVRRPCRACPSAI